MSAPARVGKVVAAIVVLSALVALILGAAASATTPAAQHVVLISLDGLRPEFYLDERHAIPRLRALAAAGSAARAVEAVFPSVTYPGHTSIVTGVRPNRHGIYFNVIFDPREGLQRDVSPGTNVVLGGVMHYIAIDAGNLAKWFKGQGNPWNTGSGSNALSDNGYSVYFSDRRNNRNAANQETGEYGFEDFVNPTNANGVPNGALDTGEDVNASAALDTYGQFPSYDGVVNALPPGAAAPLNGGARPTTQLNAPQAKVNRALLFRHALKLVNGSDIVTSIPGLTIATENPLYIQSDWNANQALGFTGSHAATSVVADAVTLLSNNWNDNISFSQPYSPGNRPRGAQTYYRVAIIGGKGQSFPHPAGWETDLGLDGGAHNFLRYLEGGGGTLNYRGSIATFYFNRQAVGTYKCCTTVYSPPTRAYAFDTDFLDPAKLPPLTPMFRDLNTIGFSQETRPGK